MSSILHRVREPTSQHALQRTVSPAASDRFQQILRARRTCRTAPRRAPWCLAPAPSSAPAPATPGPTSKITESQLAATTSAGVLGQAPAAEVGPGVLRRLDHRALDLLVGRPASPSSRGRPAGGRGPSPAGRRSTAGPRAAARATPSPGRRARGSPRAAAAWRPSPARRRSSIGSRPSRSSTHSQRSSTSAVCVVDVGAVPVLHVLAGPLEILPLDLQRGQPAAVAQRIRCFSDGSWLTALSSAPGRRCRGRAVKHLVLDHREHQRGGADLEIGGDLGQVGVTDDDVQPAVLVGVGVRLVAGVDDRPLERGLQADLDLEEVGALGDLEAGAASRPGRCRPGRPRRRSGGRRRTA